MNTGKTLFAQIMDFLPWTTFTRLVNRYGGDRHVKSLSCAEQFRIMAFAQLTYRESLRDIEACLSAQSAKLYHMGFRQQIKRSTLADANESRDWRIHAEFAQRLIAQARKLYVGEALDFELENTAYALDSTTIDLCLSVFPWAPFRTTKAAVKMHTLLDLRGNIPTFIHISDGKAARCQCARRSGTGSRGDLCHGPRLPGLQATACLPSGKRLLRYSCQIEHGCPPRLFGDERSKHRYHLRPDHRAQRLLQQPGLAGPPAPHPLQGSRDRQGTGLSDQQLRIAGNNHLRALQGALAGRAEFLP